MGLRLKRHNKGTNSVLVRPAMGRGREKKIYVRVCTSQQFSIIVSTYLLFLIHIFILCSAWWLWCNFPCCLTACLQQGELSFSKNHILNLHAYVYMYYLLCAEFELWLLMSWSELMGEKIHVREETDWVFCLNWVLWDGKNIISSHEATRKL